MARKQVPDEIPVLEDANKIAARERQKERIASNILRELGSPPALDAVKVHPLGDGRFRVNVHVLKDSNSETLRLKQSRIAHSFYVIGMEYYPAIRRLYA